MHIRVADANADLRQGHIAVFARQVRHLLKFRQIDRQNRLCGTRSVRTHGHFTRLKCLQTERLSLPVIARNRKCALEIVVVVGRTRGIEIKFTAAEAAVAVHDLEIKLSLLGIARGQRGPCDVWLVLIAVDQVRQRERLYAVLLFVCKVQADNARTRAFVKQH